MRETLCLLDLHEAHRFARRFERDTGAQADYVVVEMARRLLGENWMPEFVARANAGGIERVLL